MLWLDNSMLGDRSQQVFIDVWISLSALTQGADSEQLRIYLVRRTIASPVIYLSKHLHADV
jgi:hypothetical protein